MLYSKKLQADASIDYVPRYWGEQFDYTTRIVSIRGGGIVARPKPLVGKKPSHKRKLRRQENEKTHGVVKDHSTEAEGVSFDEETKTAETKVTVDDGAISAVAVELQGM